MKGFKVLNNSVVERALEDETRQYLVGNLKRPQKLTHIHDEKLEVGITNYEQSTNELPHYHTQATEYQYVLSGNTTYYNLDTNEEITFNAGDFYVIYPQTTYAQKSAENTRILFIKNPSINDKVNVKNTELSKTWYDKII
ncbi:cupin domain-containing protein [Psychrobacillus sp. FSL W7-1493]|uniref:cupin domain-containing protein n=1 Tax=Psychrobacillus sp. FSL W7-1493 TaxID=2921552 RepID=UPI0030F789D3